jgi:hypothetical protein
MHGCSSAIAQFYANAVHAVVVTNFDLNTGLAADLLDFI